MIEKNYQGTYWKHKNCIDVFFYATWSFSDGVNDIVNGTWATQGVNSWWFTVDDQIVIKPEQVSNWIPYTPKGKQL